MRLMSLHGCMGDLYLGVDYPRTLEVLGWGTAWRVLISPEVLLAVARAGYWMRLVSLQGRVGGLILVVKDSWTLKVLG